MTANTEQGGQFLDAIVIGAGPAGLAVAACLQRKGLSNVILERAACVAPSWHNHYHRLHLHTDKGSSALPFLPMPKAYPRYPSREQVIDYFEGYAAHFGIQPHFYQEVVGAQHDGEKWHIETKDSRYQARFLVLATGYASVPNQVGFSGQDVFAGNILHSSEYTSAAPYRGQRVLVIGFGNSGGEIALDLLENGAYPGLSVRSPTNIIPREILSVPIVTLAVPLSYLPTKVADTLTRAVTSVRYGNLSKYGLKRPRYGPLEEIEQKSRIPVIDVGTVAQIKQGHIKVYPQVTSFCQKGVSFSDGKAAPFETVIMATGFKPDLPEFLQTDLTEESTGPVGVVGTSPHLYRCGFHVVATGMLKKIGDEARWVGNDIARIMGDSHTFSPTTGRQLLPGRDR